MSRELDLLEEIFAHPEDDETRLVYADLLGDAGDPRGAIIAAQIMRGIEPSPADAEILLGPLAPWVTNARFVRGFLDEATVPFAGAPGGDPRWWTVRTLDFGGGGDLAFALDPSFRSVRSALGLSPQHLAELLVANTNAGLETAGLRTSEWMSDDLWDDLAGTPLGTVRTLVAENGDSMGRDAYGRFGRLLAMPVTTMKIDFGGAFNVGSWLFALQQADRAGLELAFLRAREPILTIRVEPGRRYRAEVFAGHDLSRLDEVPDNPRIREVVVHVARELADDRRLERPGLRAVIS